MTINEAIKSIDEVLESDYNFDETLGYQLTSDDFEWLEKSKEALENQIPEKPVYRGSINGIIPLRCPSCNAELNEEYRCCPNCGKRLEWD